MTVRTRPRPAAKKSANGKPSAHINRTTFKLARGSDWCARVARGFTRWRQRRKLTIPDAAKLLKFDQRTLYRVERSGSPATVGAHIDALCSAIEMDLIDLLKLGTPED